MNNQYTVSYSQNREDIIIQAFFPDVKKGFYVDVGANHPFFHSVTKIFYDKGWAGVNIEPNPMLLSQINQHRPNDTNLGLGVGDKKDSLDLRVYHSRDGLEGISTLSSSMKDDYAKETAEDTKKFSDIKIEVDTLENIFDKHKPAHVHFLKVDVEGFEYEVLTGNNWQKYRPELVCIEANHIMKDWRPILKSAKYSLVFNDGINDYYLAQESLARKDNFDYSEVFLLSKPVLEFHVFENIRVHKEELIARKAKIESLEKSVRERNDLIQKQEKILREITPLKKHIKRQIGARVQSIKKRNKSK